MFKLCKCKIPLCFVSGYTPGNRLRVLNLSLVQNYYTPRHAGATLAVPWSVTSKPDRPMRGVQIGYRPKTNSYDGLTPALFEALVSDLVIFGINQIELISQSFDDAPYSPHFSLSHTEMNIAMSTILAKYGINVSLWFPACHPGGDVNKGCQVGNYHDPAVMAAAKAAWNKTFASLPRMDTLFINAGDPGGQSPDDLAFIVRDCNHIFILVPRVPLIARALLGVFSTIDKYVQPCVNTSWSMLLHSVLHVCYFISPTVRFSKLRFARPNETVS